MRLQVIECNLVSLSICDCLVCLCVHTGGSGGIDSNHADADHALYPCSLAGTARAPCCLKVFLRCLKVFLRYLKVFLRYKAFLAVSRCSYPQDEVLSLAGQKC